MTANRVAESIALEGTPTMTARLLYDITETGRALSVGRTMVYKLIEQGDLATVKIGRRCLIPADAIENYIERLRASDQARSA